MKPSFYLLLFFPLFIFNSCKKEEKKNLIEIEYPLSFFDKFVGETHGVDSLITRESFEFPTSLDGELAKKNTNKSKIVSARLTYMRIQVMDYAWEDSTKYSNLKDMSMISMDIKKTGVGQNLIANKNILDIRSRYINLDLNDVELKEYLTQESFAFVVKYIKRRGMLHDMPFAINLKFKIIAESL
jgi:hypothetical protein